MFRSYFKIAGRNLLRNKVYSAINIVGLALGMMVALSIGLWVRDERSFNKYHHHYERLAQVMSTQTIEGKATTGEAVAIPLADDLRNRYGGLVKRAALVLPNFPHTLASGEIKVSYPGVWAQPDLPDMLSLKMLAGSRYVLQNPASVLLAGSAAKALFGNADPINKLIRLDNRMDFTVAGVFDDLPANTTFHETKLFLSWEKALTSVGGLKNAQSQWDSRFPRLFVELTDQADPAKLTALIKHLPGKHLKAGDEQIGLHPMAKWHLYSDFENGQSVGGRIRYVWLFSLIGGFVLLLACINFVNLSTARSEKRAKEVGIRKAVGSVRSQLIGQFLGESLLVSLLAFGLALGLMQLSLPLFNALTQKTLMMPWASPAFWLAGLGFTLSTGLLSGSYPAFYLSAAKPMSVLRGAGQAGRSTSLPRQALVVLQFTVSISLLIGTMVVYRQLQHAKNRPVGYARAGLLSIRLNTPELFAIPYELLRQTLQQTGAVAQVAKASETATEMPYVDKSFEWAGQPAGAGSALQVVGVTHDYGATVGWTINQGRDFSRQFTTDSSALIINQAAAKLIGVGQRNRQSSVGQTIRWAGKPRLIVGVVKDLVMASPYQPVLPTVFSLDYGAASYILLRLNPAVPARNALANVETAFKRINPGGVLKYTFADAEYARKFADEEQVGKLTNAFAGLAILISCLGLFGLTSFMAEQRTKEIGIRKVLGASIGSLWRLLSGDFIKLVLISLVIASPIAWYAMNRWLQDFAYKIEIEWWVFALAGTSAIGIALLTVSFQSIRAALMNPVNALRSE